MSRIERNSYKIVCKMFLIWFQVATFCIEHGDADFLMAEFDVIVKKVTELLILEDAYGPT